MKLPEREALNLKIILSFTWTKSWDFGKHLCSNLFRLLFQVLATTRSLHWEILFSTFKYSLMWPYKMSKFVLNIFSLVALFTIRLGSSQNLVNSPPNQPSVNLDQPMQNQNQPFANGNQPSPSQSQPISNSNSNQPIQIQSQPIANRPAQSQNQPPLQTPNSQASGAAQAQPSKKLKIDWAIVDGVQLKIMWSVCHALGPI